MVSRPLQWAILGAFAVACASAGYLFYQWRGGAGQSAQAGQVLLAATLSGLDDKPQPLEQWRGKVLVVNFWATWCAPCREEIPVFIDFQKRYASRGVQFIGIAVDEKQRAGPYSKDIGINYPVLVGGLEALTLSREAGNRAGVLPFTVIVDRSGQAIASTVGILKPEKLEALLTPLI